MCLRMVDGRIRVWRLVGEELDEECVAEVEPFGGGSIMVWGGISEGGKTDLVVVRGGMTADVYVDQVLRPIVVPYAAAVGPDFILMDDNATPHRAAMTNNFLDTEGIERLDWPPKSPDLNPLENLWDTLKRKVNKSITPETTLADLGRIVVRKWDAIDQQKVRRLIRGMRRRCNAVVESNGGHTKY